MADISTLNVARRTLRTTYLAEAKTNCLWTLTRWLGTQ
jgi:hypothetical protein